jgi:hypothetical protein
MIPEELVNHVHHQFARIYLGGVPSLLNDDGAFLSFITVLAGTEALAGFRHPDKGNGDRFRLFVEEYYPDPYKPLAAQLWEFRNAMVHSFSPGPFKLTHHHSEVHLKMDEEVLVLNAEDFYAALVAASRAYFEALRTPSDIQKAFLQRVSSPKGGVVVVGPLKGPT